MSVGLDAWLARIEKLHPSEIELGLERVRRVAEALGAASLSMPVITVAGTNGKGSVVALTRALAAAACASIPPPICNASTNASRCPTARWTTTPCAPPSSRWTPPAATPR
tara:strand:+ start:3167 stop:3496 length:330 start_codon:yes stop_codon:yes gene_type:complete